MKRAILFLAAGVFLLLLCADSAAAHRWPCWQDDRPCETLTQRVAFDEAVADRTWPASGCVGRYRLVWGGLPPGWDAGSSVGNVDGTCTVRVARYLRDFSEAGTLCRVFVHEAGHLSGMEHSTDPQSIMSTVPGAVRFAPCALRKWAGT